MKKIITATLLSSALLASGCATQIGLINPTAQTTPTYEKSQTFFISGVGQQQTVNAAEVCGGEQNVAKVESLSSPKDIALSMITFGIYTPHTAKVFCR